MFRNCNHLLQFITSNESKHVEQGFLRFHDQLAKEHELAYEDTLLHSYLTSSPNGEEFFKAFEKGGDFGILSTSCYCFASLLEALEKFERLEPAALLATRFSRTHITLCQQLFYNDDFRHKNRSLRLLGILAKIDLAHCKSIVQNFNLSHGSFHKFFKRKLTKEGLKTKWRATFALAAKLFLAIISHEKAFILRPFLESDFSSMVVRNLNQHNDENLICAVLSGVEKLFSLLQPRVLGSFFNDQLIRSLLPLYERELVISESAHMLLKKLVDLEMSPAPGERPLLGTAKRVVSSFYNVGHAFQSELIVEACQNVDGLFLDYIGQFTLDLKPSKERKWISNISILCKLYQEAFPQKCPELPPLPPSFQKETIEECLKSEPFTIFSTLTCFNRLFQSYTNDISEADFKSLFPSFQGICAVWSEISTPIESDDLSWDQLLGQYFTLLQFYLKHAPVQCRMTRFDLWLLVSDETLSQSKDTQFHLMQVLQHANRRSVRLWKRYKKLAPAFEPILRASISENPCRNEWAGFLCTVLRGVGLETYAEMDVRFALHVADPSVFDLLTNTINKFKFHFDFISSRRGFITCLLSNYVRREQNQAEQVYMQSFLSGRSTWEKDTDKFWDEVREIVDSETKSANQKRKRQGKEGERPAKRRKRNDGTFTSDSTYSKETQDFVLRSIQPCFLPWLITAAERKDESLPEICDALMQYESILPQLSEAFTPIDEQTPECLVKLMCHHVSKETSISNLYFPQFTGKLSYLPEHIPWFQVITARLSPAQATSLSKIIPWSKIKPDVASALYSPHALESILSIISDRKNAIKVFPALRCILKTHQLELPTSHFRTLLENKEFETLALLARKHASWREVVEDNLTLVLNESEDDCVCVLCHLTSAKALKKIAKQFKKFDPAWWTKDDRRMLLLSRFKESSWQIECLKHLKFIKTENELKALNAFGGRDSEWSLRISLASLRKLFKQNISPLEQDLLQSACGWVDKIENLSFDCTGFIKSTLKRRFGSSSAFALLAKLYEKESNNGKLIDPETVLKLVQSHSQYAKILQSPAEFVSLLLLLKALSITIDFEPFLRLYNGTTSKVDLALKSILPKKQRAKGWGKGLGFPDWLFQSTVTVELLKGPKMLESENVYVDASNLLPQLANFLKKNECDHTLARKFVDHGFIPFAILCFAHPKEKPRKAAYAVVSEYFTRLQEVDTKLLQVKPHWNNVLTILKNSIESAYQQVPSPVLSFLAHSLYVLSRPTHLMYTPVHDFLLQSATLNLTHVPLIKSLIKAHEESKLSWLLTTLLQGIRDATDAEIICKNHVLNILLTIYSRPRTSESNKNLVLNIISKCVQFDVGLKFAIYQGGFLPWLRAIRPKSDATLKNILPRLRGMKLSSILRQECEFMHDSFQL